MGINFQQPNLAWLCRTDFGPILDIQNNKKIQCLLLCYNPTAYKIETDSIHGISWSTSLSVASLLKIIPHIQELVVQLHKTPQYAFSFPYFYITLCPRISISQRNR